MSGRAAAIDLTAAMVAQATGGTIVAGPSRRAFDTVSIDSRTLEPGALFVALRGDRFDGHAFTAAALRQGAVGLLVEGEPADAGGATVIVVPDTLKALQALAHHVRRESGTTVVAITGSAGKTTTKEITADLLNTRYRVFRSRGNLNNHIGLPLSLLELRRAPDVAVVEFGMNHPGEIRALVHIAAPQIRVWTNVGDAHIGQFGSRQALAAAKAEILEDAAADTVIVANADDLLVMSHVRSATGRVVTFGESAGADVRAERVHDRGFDGSSADIATPVGRLHLEVSLPGRVQLANVLAAIVVAVELAVPLDVISATLSTVRPVERRGTSVLLASGLRLVDDSYNASPSAVMAALGALVATPTAGRRIAVLGEMLELGAAARELHEQCGQATGGLDALVVIGGPDADGLAEGARRAGLAADQVHRFADASTASTWIASFVTAGDLVLVKGSRATRTDLVADKLREVA